MSLLSLMIKFSPFLSQSFGVNDWQSCLLGTFPPKWVLLAISQSESSRGLAAVIVSCPVIHCLWSGSRICLWITSSLNSLSPSCFGSDTVAHILTRDLCTVQYSWKKHMRCVLKALLKLEQTPSIALGISPLCRSHTLTEMHPPREWLRLVENDTWADSRGGDLGCWLAVGALLFMGSSSVAGLNRAFV